jgi:hypothetical protein
MKKNILKHSTKSVFMKNKLLNRIFLSITALTFAVLLVVSCDSDDNAINDVTKPEVSNFMDNISTSPGVEFNFEGEIADETGIASIHISYENWFIDKVIVLNENPKEYSLNYKFLAPEDAVSGSSHSVKVGITDLGGNTITMDVLVILDLDITNPIVAFTSPLAGTNFSIGELVTININVTDDFDLESLQVKSSLLNLDDVVNITDGQTTYSYSNEIVIPQGLDGAVLIDAIATDKGGNTTTTTITILIGSDVQFTDLYLIGGSLWYEWDQTKATKMWQDPNDDKWFVCEFYYWTDYGVKFLGQLGWDPLNWGLDPSNGAKIINSQDSGAIEFPDGDGYYRIRFNPYSLEYDYEKMTLDIEERDNIYLMGKGFVGYDLDWNPTDAIPMVKDARGWGNPYVFNIEVEFSEEVNLKFIGQNDGWGPYDAGFEVGGEMQLPLNYAKGVTGGGSPDLKFIGQPGKYWISFDYFLLRTTIQPL